MPADETAFPTCPFCHTQDRSTTASDLGAGAAWRCVLCGQQWNARRLATVAAYAAWLAQRARSSPPLPVPGS